MGLDGVARKRQTSLRWFAVIAIAVVLVIVLGSSIIRVPPDDFGHRRGDATVAQLTKIQAALDMFRLDFGRYPTAEEGLAILWTKPVSKEMAVKWKHDGYLGRKAQDGWKRDFTYRVPGPGARSYTVISLGADGQHGGSDENADISIWD